VTLLGLSVLRPEVGRQARLRLLHITLKSMTFTDEMQPAEQAQQPPPVVAAGRRRAGPGRERLGVGSRGRRGRRSTVGQRQDDRYNADSLSESCRDSATGLGLCAA
jgi:hypothetical protein